MLYPIRRERWSTGKGSGGLLSGWRWQAGGKPGAVGCTAPVRHKANANEVSHAMYGHVEGRGATGLVVRSGRFITHTPTRHGLLGPPHIWTWSPRGDTRTASLVARGRGGDASEKPSGRHAV